MWATIRINIKVYHSFVGLWESCEVESGLSS